MNELYHDLKWFVKQKYYVAALLLTGICSYGFEITHPSIGIDDTAVPLYLSEGLEVVMGRWTIFLINKVFHLGEFTPFMLELAGVFCLMIAATLFAVLLKRIFGERIGMIGYTVFACVFISNPIISEIYIYYYHNGTDLGYIGTALALLAFMKGMEQKGLPAVKYFTGSVLLVWPAVGCCESLLILYILGILVILFLRGMIGKDKLKTTHIIKYLSIGALLCVVCVCFRELAITLITKLFGLDDVVGLLAKRSISEMSVLFHSEEGIQNLIMLLKRFWLVYHVNAIVYPPIAIYEMAIATFALSSMYLAVRKRTLWFPVLFAGMYITPMLLTIVEAKPTAYRSSQYLPFFAALGIFLCYGLLGRIRLEKRIGQYVGIALTVILVWNQVYYMNKSFYTDWLKYEHTKDVMLSVAHEIEQDYGRDKPVIFTGHYDVPHSLVSDYYVGFGSWQYRLISAITDVIDPHLKEKYHSSYGYCFIGEANYPFIQWALDAFDNTNRELHAFLKMHGYEFYPVTDLSVLEEARTLGDTMPRFPLEGSIAAYNDYIIVHF
ncbi:MAG: hypothetical protein HFH82_13690 [Lachnospiraceae bacterium]|nr:hypothetical protein [Lachnospiraceae bacterium]